MLFSYFLASALTISAALGRSSGPEPRYVMYETEDSSIGKSEETAQIMDVNDRSSNLKYVMAIQSSSIWEEIKKRSLTLHRPQKLDGTVDENSPDDLTDQELAQLKQACHDGLKCVAVDQLIVLEQVKEPLVGGKVSVRTAITKITQVLTQYTTEYHEDVYQYEAVSESDDESKVYNSVTTIVEDNKELCRIDFTPPTEENNPKDVDGKSVPVAADNPRTINYNTINNYNINNGTLNSVTINTKPDLDVAIGVQTQIESENGSSDHHDDNADHQSMPPATVNSTPAIGNESDIKAPKNDVQDKPTSVDHPEYARSTSESKPMGQPLMITDGPSPLGGSAATATADTGTDNSGRGQKSQRSRPNATARTNSANTDEPAANNEIILKRGNGAHASDHAEKTTNDSANNNTIKMDNSSAGGNAGGENDSDSDIVSAGSHNANISRKGMVEDGILNNGNMKAKTFDTSNRNKGTIKGGNADRGIVSIGTTNNGPTNYGKVNSNTNNGNTPDMNNTDILRYVDNIDKMYSTILNEFAKN
ncbi:uncharacterized protein DDB_G0287625-like [Myzus persicae]|uniref:uncharacterized protein DDB_G0287625-like n=1 Tax=Myzus persicae TaxID=13164 RepID=UPI000B930E54|nr:uncharacterized protein DDB_G0287625-like [Myzus persicae]